MFLLLELLAEVNGCFTKKKQLWFHILGIHTHLHTYSTVNMIVTVIHLIFAQMSKQTINLFSKNAL